MPSKLTDSFDTFIFDWDGTLNSPSILNHPFWLRFRKWAFSNKKPVDSAELVETAKHIYRRNATGEFEALEMSATVKLLDMALYVVRPRFHNGAKEVLEALNNNGKNVALFTDGGLKRIYAELKRLHAVNYFELILSAQSIKRLKPDPLGLQIIIDAIKSEKSRVIYFGDRPEDIIAAKAAGIKSAAMGNGFSNPQVLKKYEPDMLFNSMEDVLQRL